MMRDDEGRTRHLSLFFLKKNIKSKCNKLLRVLSNNLNSFTCKFIGRGHNQATVIIFEIVKEDRDFEIVGSKE